MESLVKQARNFYARNRISSFEYDCVRSEIYSTNRSVLSVCTFVSMTLFFILSILSVVIKDSVVFRDHIVYASIFLFHLALFIVCLKLPEQYNRAVVTLMYLFIWSFNVYTIAAGVFDRPDNFAVIYIVFEFAYPLIFVDKIRRIYLNSIFAGVIFCCLSVWKKSPEYWKVDIFNTVVFYCLSYLPSFYLAKVRVREFSLRQIIESERDTDQLTGLLNKSAFIRQAKKSINATKNGILIIMDLDFFKQINDTYGHFTGDHALKLVSMCINQTFRSTDVMGRFGGDEFVIFMAKTDLTNIAELRCNQLLDRLHSTRLFPEDSSNDTVIHASIGFVPYTNENDFDTLFQKADKALYEAKNTGKDKACQFH